MIYRVRIKIGYNKVFFDFDNANEAIWFMDAAMDHVSSSLFDDTDDELEITMKVIKEETPISGNS